MFDVIRQNVLPILKALNEYGAWNLLTFIGVTSIFSIAWNRSRKRLDQLSIHVTYKIGTGHPLYPNVVFFEVRSLMDSPIIINRPNFQIGKYFVAGNNAHGNSATGDYEIKFRPITSNGDVMPGHSYTAYMLRHRDAVMGYLPIDDSLTEEATFKARLNKKPLGIFYMDVVLLRNGKPTVHSMKIPVRNMTPCFRNYTLGGVPTAVPGLQELSA